MVVEKVPKDSRGEEGNVCNSKNAVFFFNLQWLKTKKQ